MQVCRQAQYNRLRRLGGAFARTRSGFTLVEVLIVIAIIGVLVGLLIPAVNMARRSVQQTAIAFEVEALANAVEQYKNKYGDYPPDGSNGRTFQNHLRKAFPNIAQSEIDILGAMFSGRPVSNAAVTGSVMDPPEALVFFLGGFSNDPQFPFSGPGGPLFLTNASGVQVKSDAGANIQVVQYNADRSNAFFEFKPQQLSIHQLQLANSLITESNDELALFGALNDVMPVYYSGGTRRAPFVYFDSRSYRVSVYAPTQIDSGAVRPYKSNQMNTTTASNPLESIRFMNERAFQIVSAGLDDAYGGRLDRFYIFPTGEWLNAATGARGDSSGYISEAQLPSTQLDNATNFSEGILGNSLP